MTHPLLTEELRERPDGDLLESAISLCFITPNAIERLNALWPERVASYRSRSNTDDIVREKATVLTAYVVHNLGVAVEASRDVLKDERDITEDQEIIVKIEEAALWYRLIDELSYVQFPEQRLRFMSFFEDNLSNVLALQGAEPETITATMAARSEEYAQYRDWVACDNQSVAGTLLWNAAKHIAVPLGCEHDPIFTTLFAERFINRVVQAMVYELLTGKQRATAK